MNVHSAYDYSNSQRVAQRRERNKELIALAKEKCAEHAGACEIGDGFVIVNTKHYEVKPK